MITTFERKTDVSRNTTKSFDFLVFGLISSKSKKGYPKKSPFNQLFLYGNMEQSTTPISLAHLQKFTKKGLSSDCTRVFATHGEKEDCSRFIMRYVFSITLSIAFH